MRTIALLAAACLAVPAALAQAPAANAAREQLDPRGNRKVERIRTEDAGSRIDEVRVGGETQSVTVQPKAEVPAYEIIPADTLRTRPADARDGLAGTAGKRVWNVLAF
jgi:Ni/Co efflux regulator RcnB